VPDEQTSARVSYDEVAIELKLVGATSGAMFGMPTLKNRRQGVAGYVSGAMVFKLARRRPLGRASVARCAVVRADERPADARVGAGAVVSSSALARAGARRPAHRPRYWVKNYAGGGRFSRRLLVGYS
jgi:hypothetical protein